MLVLSFAAVDRPAWAVEGGAPQWPTGVDTVAPSVMPAAGETAFYNYTLYYHADSFKDRNGKDSIPGFDLSVWADAPRITHTWETKLGPLNMSTNVVLAGDWVKVEQEAAPGVHLEDSTVGLDFLYLVPLYLTYNTSTLHLLFGPGVTIPAGQFSTHDLANPTRNYYSFGLEVGFTYFPMKTLEICAQTDTMTNATNPATNYHSGSTLDIDWGVNWAPIASVPNLFFGIQGSYITQFTNDKINNVTVGPDGFRLQIIALGPQLIYYFNPKAGIVAKYQREFDTENGPEGDRFWIEFVVPIGRAAR